MSAAERASIYLAKVRRLQAQFRFLLSREVACNCVWQTVRWIRQEARNFNCVKFDATKADLHKPAMVGPAKYVEAKDNQIKCLGSINRKREVVFKSPCWWVNSQFKSPCYSASIATSTYLCSMVQNRYFCKERFGLRD